MKNLKISKLKQQYTYGATGIQDLSIECDKGEIISIFAPSDGGKTSLLKAVAKLAPTVSGDIFIKGENIAKLKPKELDILLVHQDDGGLFNRKSVYFNLSFSLKIRKVPKQIIRDKIQEVSYSLDINHLLKEKIYRLTDRQKVKVALARALLRDACVYLIDNPFQAVSEQERHSFFMEMLPYLKNLTGAVLFATDNIDEARTVSEQVVLLNYGVVVDSGSFERILKNPASLSAYRIVRDYEENEVVVTVREDDGDIAINILGKKIIINNNNLINPIYIDKEIIVVFKTIVAEEGEEYGFEFLEYYHKELIMHSKIGGISIKTILKTNELPKYIIPDASSIKLFDINTERIVLY